MEWVEDVAFPLEEEYLQRLPDAYEYVFTEFELEEYVSAPEQVRDAELKPYVFIAAPYSEPYTIHNMNRAMHWFDVLMESPVVTPHCPHWTGTQDLVRPQPYEKWLAHDKQVVRRSDAMLRLTGDSAGADGEVALMERLERPVFYEESFEELFEWAVDWIKKENDVSQPP